MDLHQGGGGRVVDSWCGWKEAAARLEGGDDREGTAAAGLEGGCGGEGAAHAGNDAAEWTREAKAGREREHFQIVIPASVSGYTAGDPQSRKRGRIERHIMTRLVGFLRFLLIS